MDKPRSTSGPLLVAVVMLLLPIIYVGVYLALVDPFWSNPGRNIYHRVVNGGSGNYRGGGMVPEGVFFPLEQIDRRVRPDAWEPPADHFPQ